MKAFWKSRPVKTVGILAALLVLGMLIAAATGHGETAQSGVLGTVFAPAHWAAEKISDGLATLSGNAKGNTEYEKKIDELQRQLGEMQAGTAQIRISALPSAKAPSTASRRTMRCFTAAI